MAAMGIVAPSCRACGGPFGAVMVDLGLMPLANSYLHLEDLHKAEARYPLRVVVCRDCLLAQLDYIVDTAALFSEYAYFSSYSDSWLDHARRYVDDVAKRFSLTASSRVIEVASNDGYLLQYFVARGIPALGVEPARNVAEAAIRAGVPTRNVFFNGSTVAAMVREGLQADLIVANNVLAHVPDLNDFVSGFTHLLNAGGVATFEFPHLLRLIEEHQFDTIYHEHFSYFSLLSVERVFARHGLEVFDVQPLTTHGGSLRLFVQHDGGPHATTSAVAALREDELAAGLHRMATYEGFGRFVEQLRDGLLRFITDAHAAGKKIAGYGAPAKGNTLLNYCHLGPDTIELTVDRNIHKQNCYLPGSHIPIRDPSALRQLRPDYLIILAWNLKDEIMAQVPWIHEWGGRFFVAIPEIHLYG
jgi:SAM-dependent methyltransferase